MLKNRFTIEDEKEIQKLWEESKIFKFNGIDERKIYSVDTPPPTVSGNLHIGHIFSFTQSEMIVRYHRLKGENIYYPFGFDDNGLPTERLVEKVEKITASTISRDEFVKKCNLIKNKYINEFKNLFKRLGISADWDLGYDTVNELSMKISQRLFIDLVKKGKAYRKEMPVLWCPYCKTSIAQAELECKEVNSYFDYINFEVEGKKLVVTTTRPEFLGGCVAVFVNPNDERYKDLIGKFVKVPIYENDVPILSSEKVESNVGTGVIMCCTYANQTDIEFQQEFNLPVKKIMNSDGTISKNVKIVGGMKVRDARLKIIEELQKRDLLDKIDKTKNSINIHERCENEIEIINSMQWYIDILSIKDELIKLADEINWYPETMKNRYLDWVNNLKWDWCISRQRYFGVPFPVWYCKECGDIILADDEELPVNPLDSSYPKKCKCGCNDLIAENAVMDTWATSSITPFINMKFGESNMQKFIYPMSMRSHAHEIIRTWTFYSIVRAFYHTREVPWKNLMISGFVLAKKGEKISKSKNNAKFSPLELLEKYGADAIRYWTASNKLGTDTYFDESSLSDAKRFLNKLWNSSKFVSIHLQDFNLEDEVTMLSIDKWIISKCQMTFDKYSKQMEKYEIGLARQEVDNFFWKDFCDNYLEIVKERLYNEDNRNAETRKSAQKALYYVLLEILKMYSPFVPHITEFIYQDLYKKSEIDNFLSSSTYRKLPVDHDIINFGEAVKIIIREVRKYKTSKGVSLKEPFDNIKIITSLNNLYYLKDSILDFQACIHAMNIEFDVDEQNTYVEFLPLNKSDKGKTLILKNE